MYLEQRAAEDTLFAKNNVAASIWENAIMGYHRATGFHPKWLIPRRQAMEFTDRVVQDFDVKVQNLENHIGSLSGGNIQKLIVGREFSQNNRLLLIEDPTRGIDVGAIEFIRKKIVDMRARKKAILLVSADLSEILSLSDTILVMHEGRIVGHISDVKNTSENDLGLYMLGVKEDSKEQIGGAYCE